MQSTILRKKEKAWLSNERSPSSRSLSHDNSTAILKNLLDEPGLKPMSKKFPVAALLTDFGLHDHYVGVMRAVMLSICPSLRIVEITNEVDPQNVEQAAYLLWASYRYMPSGTIIVCVVDPGVGSSRDILVVKTKQYSFLAPRNGLLDMVLWQEQVREVIVFQPDLPESKSILPKSISSTFHGRDIFAPLAAHLALGARASSFGRRTRIDRLNSPFARASDLEAQSRILHIDRFGNIITNLDGTEENLQRMMRGLQIGSRKVDRWARNFTSAADDEPCLLLGSSGLVEIVMRNKSAAAYLHVDLSSPLRVLR